jgi:hypothetical protein
MSHRFPLKNLLFYGSMIGAVIVLFEVTTLYGENHLKAPPNLNGRYLSDRALPGCPDSSRLALNIHQSGIYLSGSLLLADATAPQQTADAKETAAEEKPSLSGLWQQQQIGLSGETNALASCQASGASGSSQTAAASSKVDLQGQITQPPAKSLTGQISLGGGSPVEFTAQHQAPPAKSGAAH